MSASSDSPTIPSPDSPGPGYGDFETKKLVVVKIFTRVLVPDVEYKTLSISRTTSCRQVIHMLLAKFRLKNRDPNLFFLTIDVWTRRNGIPVRSVLMLDERTCPVQLQTVYPQQQGTKFTLQMRQGHVVRVFDDSCSSNSLGPANSAPTEPTSLLLSERTSADELIQLILRCNNSQETESSFSLYEVSRTRNYERQLHPKDLPVKIQQEWSSKDLLVFVLKRSPNFGIPDSLSSELLTPTSCPWSRLMDCKSINTSFGNKLKSDGDEVSPSGSSDSLSTVCTVKSSLTATSSASYSSVRSSSSDYDNFYL